ncbi:MAG: DUF2089 domain-containing protein [Ardenticatenaceae bacterium]|nr:DUF2089 domain-containing protein [Ardenticatenaceae bacterium]
MHPVPNRCPICQQSEIIVTQLDCPKCQSKISGQFSLHRLHRLTADQLQFVEIFLLNEGKINRVEQEMGLSYAAVRARLQEIVETLGGSPTASPSRQTVNEPVNQPDPQLDAENRKAILAKVSSGEISAADAVSLLSGKRSGA